MTTDSPILADLDPWERINRMPDERPLKSAEAAVLMTFSLSTLERMRADGTGPDYFRNRPIRLLPGQKRLGPGWPIGSAVPN